MESNGKVERSTVVGKVPDAYTQTLKECADLLQKEDGRRRSMFAYSEMRSASLLGNSLQVRSFGYRSHPPLGGNKRPIIAVGLSVSFFGTYDVIIDPEDFTYEVVDHAKYSRKGIAGAQDKDLGATIGGSGYISKMPCEWGDLMGALASFIDQESQIFFGRHHRQVQADLRTGERGYDKATIVDSDKDLAVMSAIASRLRSVLNGGL